MLPVKQLFGQRLRPSHAVCEIAVVEAVESCSRVLSTQMPYERWTNVAHIAQNKDFHAVPLSDPRKHMAAYRKRSV